MTPRQIQALNLLTYFLIVFIVGLMLLSIREINKAFNLPSVPISINESTIVADNPIVCPGDMLQWSVSITYNDAPLLMDVYRHVRNLENGRLMLEQTEHIVITQETTGSFDRRSMWRVPTLSPGRYRLITTTKSATGSQLLQYYVELEISLACDANSAALGVH